MLGTIDPRILQELFSKLSTAFHDAAEAMNSNSSHKEAVDVPSESSNDLNVEKSNAMPKGQHDGRQNPSSVALDNLIQQNKTHLVGEEDNYDYHEMSKAQLESICKAKNLNIIGRKWELIQRIVASNTPEPKAPKGAIMSFRLQSFERKSNSNHIWNPKCHSGKSMYLYMHICRDTPNGKSYLFCNCQCGNQCVRAWALGGARNETKLTLLFNAADTTGHWVNYPCQFKAAFENEDDLKKFKGTFEQISDPFEFEPPDDVNDDCFQFQSQAF